MHNLKGGAHEQNQRGNKKSRGIQRGSDQEMIKLITATIAGVIIAGSALLGASAADEARIRVIHSSPDAPAVDVYANGAKVLSDVPYLASSGYLTVPAGAYTFEVFVAGANPDTDAAVLTIPADLEAGVDYTVVALNEVASIEPAVFVDNNSSPAAGKAHISVIHAGPDAPAVDVAVAGGPVLVGNLALGESAGPLPVNAGTYDLEVRVAGTTDVALALPSVALEEGSIYTFIATGFLAGDPALTVEAYVETPVANVEAVAPPASGSGGLLDPQEGGNSIYLLGGAAVLLVGVTFVGAARRISTRS
jgi:Domain of unknown function (DUF4397)